MASKSPPNQKTTQDLSALRHLGTEVRERRNLLGLSRSELADRSGISLRFLAQLEAGTGNISFLRLLDLSRALGVDVATLVGAAEDMKPRPIALLGMRGAGKSTVGAELSKQLGLEFFELDELVESEAGMPLAQIFELQGQPFYRQLERGALTRFLSEKGMAILATGGGIVTETETFSLLRRRTFTVWLRASPVEHWKRVVAQGDRRPMHNQPDAMSELERLWTVRARQYAGADLVVETSLKPMGDVVREIEFAYRNSQVSGSGSHSSTSTD